MYARPTKTIHGRLAIPKNHQNIEMAYVVIAVHLQSNQKRKQIS